MCVCECVHPCERGRANGRLRVLALGARRVSPDDECGFTMYAIPSVPIKGRCVYNWTLYLRNDHISATDCGLCHCITPSPPPPPLPCVKVTHDLLHVQPQGVQVSQHAVYTCTRQQVMVWFQSQVPATVWQASVSSLLTVFPSEQIQHVGTRGKHPGPKAAGCFPRQVSSELDKQDSQVLRSKVRVTQTGVNESAYPVLHTMQVFVTHPRV